MEIDINKTAYLRADTNVSLSSENLLKHQFKHIKTYVLLFYIIGNYDYSVERVRIVKSHFINNMGFTKNSISNAIDELLNNKIISVIGNKKDWYNVNVEFLKFI